MSAGISAATQSLGQSVEARAQSSERLFYVVAGGAMLIATAVGFRLFIVHGKVLGEATSPGKSFRWSSFMDLPCSVG